MSKLKKKKSYKLREVIKVITRAVVKILVSTATRKNVNTRDGNERKLCMTVPGYGLVKLKIKGSRNIPYSFRQYCVRIVYLKSPLARDAKKTSYILAPISPKWNETLIFLVKKTNWNVQQDLELECSLISDHYKDDADMKSVSTNMVTLKDEKVLIFDQIQVDVDVEEQWLTDVRIRPSGSICREEKTFVGKRKAFVLKTMNTELELDISNVDDVPTIAIIGSGGGMRAVIGMCGAINALQDYAILDSAMYITGVSGSAWYLLTLYANDEHLNPKAASASIRKKLHGGNNIQLLTAWYRWKYYAISKALNSRKYFTITDTFGEMIGDLLLGEKCNKKWSHQREKLHTGCVPLPIVTALHVRDEERILEYHEWIEMSPYEALIPKYGVSVDMRNFGDKFYGGFIIRKYGEQPIHFLAGMCGSAYTGAKDSKPPENKWFMKLSQLKKWIHQMYDSFDKTCIAKVPNWLRGLSIYTYRVEPDSDTNRKDSEKKEMMLVDAGLSFNSPYPPVLLSGRDVDIIISFDFSDRGDDHKWPFWELVKAKKWAKKRDIPFPELDLKNKKPVKIDGKNVYEEMYIFQSDNAPTILHFVMVNNRFRTLDTTGDKETNFDILPDYSTYEFNYSNEEFDKLKSLIEYNVFINKAKIVDSIQSVINKKKQQRAKRRQPKGRAKHTKKNPYRPIY